jgi:hypothetical protein
VASAACGTLTRLRAVPLTLLLCSLAGCGSPPEIGGLRDGAPPLDAGPDGDIDAALGDGAAPIDDAGERPDVVPAPDRDHRPAWLEGQAVGEWRAIPGSSMSLAPPSVPGLGNVSARIHGWASLSIDDRSATVYSAANGGYTDYAGNEVVAIALHADAPRWIELRAPTPAAQLAERSSHYLDGRPSSRESFYGQVFLERRNRAITLGGAYWQGGAGPQVDAFDLARLDWDPAGTFPLIPLRFYLFAWSVVEDERTGDLYVFDNRAVYRWIDAANRWETTVAGTAISGNYSASATDVARRRILLIEGAGTGHLYDIEARSAVRITLSGVAAAEVGSEGALGIVHEPVTDRFLVRRAGGGPAVYAIDAGTFAVEMLATRGGEAIPPSVNGVYRRFLYAPTLGGVVLYPDYSGEMWFLRTH